MSSYDYDSDEASEQLLADQLSTNGDVTTVEIDAVTGGPSTTSQNSRFDALLQSVGLDLSSTIGDLPTTRRIHNDKHRNSHNDVFCNRELNMGNVRAVGFDMDYTIAQYKQPAFDKLAFDGAKEKLVNMGYPKELLDVEYDHTVSYEFG